MVHTPASRRWTAIGLLLAIVVLPVGASLAWAGAWCVGYCRALYDTAEVVQGYELAIAEAPARRRAIDAMQRALATEHAFYDDSTSERASASMAQSLRETVQQSGGDLRSVTIDPTLPVNGLDKMQVGLDLVVPSASLPRFLSALQTMRPFMFVSSLSVSSAQFGSAEGQLWVTMKVSAFRGPHRDAI